MNYIYLRFKPASGYVEYHSFIQNFLDYPIHKTICFLGTIGSNIIHDSSYTVFCGIILSTIFILILFFNKYCLDFSNTAPWYGLISYSLLVSFFLTLSRSGNGAQFGPVDMLLFIPGNRHFPSTILLLIGIFCLAIHYYLRNKRTFKFCISSKKDHSCDFNTFSISIFLVSSLFIFMILGSVFHIAPGLVYGVNWYSNYYETALELKNYNNIPDEKLSLIHPNHNLTIDSCHYMELNRLNIFDYKNQSINVNSPILNKIRNYLLDTILLQRY
jgi:hypothetical protein